MNLLIFVLLLYHGGPPMLVANWRETGSFLLCVRCFPLLCHPTRSFTNALQNPVINPQLINYF